MIALKRILVATDFGEASDAALAYGRELARRFDGQLYVLNAADDLLARIIGVDKYGVAFPELQQGIEQIARGQMAALLKQEIAPDIRTEGVTVTSAAPAQTIIDFAQAEKIDLIVMGTHGRGAVAHLLMGSVAEKVVRLAPCPVLTVRSPERDFVKPDALQAVTRSRSPA